MNDVYIQKQTTHVAEFRIHIFFGHHHIFLKTHISSHFFVDIPTKTQNTNCFVNLHTCLQKIQRSLQRSFLNSVRVRVYIYSRADCPTPHYPHPNRAPTSPVQTVPYRPLHHRQTNATNVRSRNATQHNTRTAANIDVHSFNRSFRRLSFLFHHTSRSRLVELHLRKRCSSDAFGENHCRRHRSVDPICVRCRALLHYSFV